MTSSTNRKDRLHQTEDAIARRYHGELLGTKENNHQEVNEHQDPGLTLQGFRARNRGQGDIARSIFKIDK